MDESEKQQILQDIIDLQRWSDPQRAHDEIRKVALKWGGRWKLALPRRTP